MSTLPETDEDQLRSLREEYEELSKDGGTPASEACFRSDVLPLTEMVHDSLSSQEKFEAFFPSPRIAAMYPDNMKAPKSNEEV